MRTISVLRAVVSVGLVLILSCGSENSPTNTNGNGGNGSFRFAPAIYLGYDDQYNISVALDGTTLIVATNNTEGFIQAQAPGANGVDVSFPIRQASISADGKKLVAVRFENNNTS